MARARNKQQLFEFGEKEFTNLQAIAKEYESNELLDVKIFDNRTVKDILAHLIAWHRLFFTW